MSYKPDTYNAATPYLIIPNAADCIDFLVAAFDAEAIRRIPTPSGARIMHAEVRIDDSIIMIADANEDWPPINAHVHIYVPDVDAAYARAIAHGAESVQSPETKDDGDRRGGVKNACGTTWWLATRMG